ncbi:superoxide dismutase [Streptomyces sp. E11-3]|uniref:SMP-30/gluconolactonase/LRE family protein n=1 Tax=Streptomyces sp. E11-3 TaxID=3110112 RepID=UPI003981194F
MSQLASHLRLRPAAVLLALGLALPATPAVAEPAGLPHHRVATAHELPGDRVYPEGIAADQRTGDLYVGSYTTGAVYRITPGQRTATVFLPAGTDGRDTANGLKVDRAGRLWVTDSTAGVAVYDVRTRRLLARFDVEDGEGETEGAEQERPFFVNDLAIAPDGSAYLTDSIRAVIYRVTPDQLARGGRSVLRPYVDVGGDLDPRPVGTFTLNGIVADPAGRFLLAVDMTGGDLVRVDLRSREVRRVALSGGDLVHGDGLELRHGRLWAAHNASQEISRWRLSYDGTRARQERRVGDEALQIPTTLVRHRGRTLVVRSQFDKGGPMGPGTPETPFTVAVVRGV